MKLKHFVSMIILLLVVTGLACGLGSSSSSGDEATDTALPKTAIADTAPMVTITNPTPNEQITLDQTTSSILRGPYLGQKPPGKVPIIFMPGLVSTEENTDFSSSFSPDGTEFYFTRRRQGGANQLLYSKMVNNIWTTPKVVSFVKHYDASEAHISPDGKYILYGSRKLETSNSTVWYSERRDSGWGEPKQLLEDMMYATLSLKNQLYYTDKSGGNISTALLMSARFEAGELIDIKEVSIANESGIGRAHPFISPDESFLIFDQIGDLYVTFLGNDRAWSPSKKLNPEINTSAYEFAPYVSPDGKYLFFTRDDNVYWVDAKIIEDLKPQELKH